MVEQLPFNLGKVLYSDIHGVVPSGPTNNAMRLGKALIPDMQFDGNGGNGSFFYRYVFAAS